MGDVDLEILRSYDMLSQYEAAMLVAETTDIKSEKFLTALKRIDRAIYAKKIIVVQAIDCEKERGNKDKSEVLRWAKLLKFSQTHVDEKQAMIQRDDFLKWMAEEDKIVEGKEPKTCKVASKLPRTKPNGIEPKEVKPLDRRRETSLLCLIAALATKLGYLPSDRNTVGKIKMMLEEQGLKMSNKTISSCLDDASERKKEIVTLD